MKIRTYLHRSNETDWKSRESSTVIKALKDLEIKIESGCSKNLRDCILNLLHMQGWSSEVKLSHATAISITAIKGNYGLCLQTGNMSRFYADLLKLQYLFQKGTIIAALYILPTKHNAKLIGSNLANFERMTRELKLFRDIITIPIFVIGIN